MMADPLACGLTTCFATEIKNQLLVPWYQEENDVTVGLDLFAEHIKIGDVLLRVREYDSTHSIEKIGIASFRRTQQYIHSPCGTSVASSCTT